MKRKFESDFKEFEDPENQHLPVLYVMFRDKVERYYTDYVASTSFTNDETFQLMKAHFTTSAHRDKRHNKVKQSDVHWQEM